MNIAELGRGLEPSLRRALVRVASVETLLVACDYDGTLAPIVDDPAEARPQPRAMEVIGELAGTAGTWASLVSGRSLQQLIELSGPPATVGLVGSHGAEHLAPVGSDGRVGSDPAVASGDPGVSGHHDAESAALLEALIADVADEVSRLPGSRLEPKPVGVAFHYRQADQSVAAKTADALIERLSARPGVHVRVGKMVAEFAVDGADKGQALLRLIGQTGPDATVFVGDDVTDEDGFAVLGEGDLGIKVGAGETAASHRVASPADVVEVLSVLAQLRRAGAGIE